MPERSFHPFGPIVRGLEGGMPEELAEAGEAGRGHPARRAHQFDGGQVDQVRSRELETSRDEVCVLCPGCLVAE
jgi:hypothetical protein